MSTRPDFFDSDGAVVFDIQIYVPRGRGSSAVDAFIESATYSDGRSVPDTELDYLSKTYDDYVQQYAYENGSRNHN